MKQYNWQDILDTIRNSDIFTIMDNCARDELNVTLKRFPLTQHDISYITTLAIALNKSREDGFALSEALKDLIREINDDIANAGSSKTSGAIFDLTEDGGLLFIYNNNNAGENATLKIQLGKFGSLTKPSLLAKLEVFTASVTRYMQDKELYQPVKDGLAKFNKEISES